MNPMAAASPPLIPSDPRRARLRGHPSGLKGRCAITTVTDLRPALDPGASAAPHPQRHGQHQRRCPPERAALTQNPYKSSLYGSGGLPVQYGFELAAYAVGWLPYVGWLAPLQR